jgi:hypothetical protein
MEYWSAQMPANMANLSDGVNSGCGACSLLSGGFVMDDNDDDDDAANPSTANFPNILL